MAEVSLQFLEQLPGLGFAAVAQHIIDGVQPLLLLFGPIVGCYRDRLFQLWIPGGQ